MKENDHHLFLSWVYHHVLNQTTHALRTRAYTVVVYVRTYVYLIDASSLSLSLFPILFSPFFPSIFICLLLAVPVVLICVRDL